MTIDVHEDDSLDQPGVPGDAIAARLLDESVSADDLPQCAVSDRHRIADLLWLHSLLEQVLHADPAARERRIAGACQAIREDAARPILPASTINRRRAAWLVPSLVAVALVIAAVFIRTNVVPPESAMAAVESTLQQAKSNQDRLYHVDTKWQTLLKDEPLQLTGDLWVRGNSEYLLEQHSPLGDIRLGSNGKEQWVVLPIGPVLIGDSRRIEQVIADRPVATPFLQVTSMLERLTKRYDLTLAPEEELPAVEDSGTVRCTHVIGRKRDPEDYTWPDVIHLWTARQSGIAYRIRAEWTGDRTGPKELQLQLMPLPAPVADDWYEHATHHAPDRRVLRRPSEQ